MALTVAPKPAALRQRRNRTTTQATIEAPPALRPQLGDGHHPRTLAWWDAIWSSPISAEWVDADVPGLLELAVLRDAFWTAETGPERAKIHAELRQGDMQFGLTPFGRRSLQWEIKRVERASTSPAAAPAPTRRRDPRLRALG